VTEEFESIRRISADGTGGVSEPPNAARTWWGGYKEALRRSGISESAIEVIDLDSSYLLTAGIQGAGLPRQAGSQWPVGRLRRGLVMGSVQSGKTASLLAVTAKALDSGVNIVVILAGTRLALWRQTLSRTLVQLDQWSIERDSASRSRRVFIPTPTVLEETERSRDLDALYFETPNLVRRMLLEGKPLIAVVMKNVDHLMCFSRYLHKVVDVLEPRLESMIQMLVIDDEADDGSILDRDVEAGLTPDSELLKQIPRHIARIWSGHASPSETLCKKVFATYVAYTATPQANFLQSAHNPLSPTEFVAALRTPADVGSIKPPRQNTYFEPNGITRYYIGGEFFYRRLATGVGRLCMSEELPNEPLTLSGSSRTIVTNERRSEMLANALRAYFVGGAIRLLIDNKKLSVVRSIKGTSLDELVAVCPSPHTMLYHPSARIGEHFVAAKEVVDWCNELDQTAHADFNATTDAVQLLELNAKGLKARLEAEEGKWEKWLVDFQSTSARLSFLPGGQQFLSTPPLLWSDVKALLVSEVFPNTRLSVINSDPRADDHPGFEPLAVGPAMVSAPKDIFTIFVSGNVMARGITLEGLCVSMFVRSADEPLADTQMQMQRWFGYRGKHLPFCRLFLFEDQLDLFRSYHEGDEALRSEIIEEMNKSSGRAPTPLVLEGRQYRATGKIANLRALPLCPGPDPFVRIVEVGKHAKGNAEVLGRLLEGEQWQPLAVTGTTRGIAMKRQLNLVEVATLLESLNFESHVPDPDSANNQRWQSIASELGLKEPESPLFRPPKHDGNCQDAVDPRYCPYTIAAYLRLWQAMLTRRARGFVPTDDPRTPWSMIDLVAYARSAPRFNVGVRYGQAGSSSHPALAKHGVLRMDRGSKGGLFVSTWGSRNPGDQVDSYLGDQLFDYHLNGLNAPNHVQGEPLWRPRGAPGLLLFHIVRDPEGAHDATTVGVGIPSGGPDHIAALRTRSV